MALMSLFRKWRYRNTLHGIAEKYGKVHFVLGAATANYNGTTKEMELARLSRSLYLHLRFQLGKGFSLKTARFLEEHYNITHARSMEIMRLLGELSGYPKLTKLPAVVIGEPSEVLRYNECNSLLFDGLDGNTYRFKWVIENINDSFDNQNKLRAFFEELDRPLKEASEILSSKRGLIRGRGARAAAMNRQRTSGSSTTTSYDDSAAIYTATSFSHSSSSSSSSSSDCSSYDSGSSSCDSGSSF